MLTFGLLGVGNIAKVHAGNLAANPRTRLKHVVDVDASAAGELASAYGAQVSSLAAMLGDPEVAAVLIATPGGTHSELIEAAANAGKAIFCEKPIGIEVDCARRALDVARQAGVRLTIGFHRRFDPSFLAAQQRIAAGEIGALQVLSIVSRDPGVPTLEQSRAAGGMFCESSIHDMDMARWLLAEEPSELFAMGSCLVDPQLAEADDVDSVVIALRTASGKLCQITGSRGSAYGYDQRLEALGASGMIRVDNVTPTTVTFASGDNFQTDLPLAFYPERYPEAYRRILDGFVDGVASGEDRTAKGEDGLRALILVNAARKSAQTGQVVRIDR